MTADLVEFLRARLDEDEERARFVQRERGDRHEIESWRLSCHDEYDLLCIEPSRALAEVAAKRRIIDEGDDRYDGADEHWRVLALLALPYADHPDYDEEWRP